MRAATPAVALTWDANTETNLGGYMIRYGFVRGNYSLSNDVGRVTNATVSGLLEGTNYFFVVTAYDTSRLESDPSNEVSYRVPKLTPVISAIPAQSTPEDTLKLVAFSASGGTNGSSLALAAISSDPLLVPTANIVFSGSGTNFTASIRPQSNLFGTVTLTLVASNGALSASRSFVLTVNSVNDVPTLNPLGNLSLQEDAVPQLVALSGISSGAANENQNLTVTAISSNPALIPNPTVTYTSPNGAGTLRFTPLTNASGTTTITVTVNDGQAANNILVRSFDVVVAAVNDAPTLSAIASQQTAANTPTAFIPFSVRDVDTAPASLFLSAASANETLVPSGNILFGGSGSNRTVQLTPASGQSGQSTITLSVNDGLLTATTTFLLTISPPSNSPPVLSALSAQSTIEDTPKVISFSAAAGTNSSGVTVTVSSSDPTLVPPANIALSRSGTNYIATITPQSNRWGAVTITLVASNGLLRTSGSFVLTVNAVNDPPTVSAIASQQLEINSVSPVISFTVQDPDSSVAGLVLSAVSSDENLLPSGNIVFGGTGSNRTVQLTPGAGQSGQADITVVVTDGFLTGDSTFVCAVTPPSNSPPVISVIPAQSTPEDTLKVVAFSAFAGANSSGLTVTALSSDTTLVPPANILLAGAAPDFTLSLLPQSNRWGAATITLVASNDSLSVSRSFVFTVNPVNDAPTLEPLDDLALLEDAGSQTIALSGITSGATNESQALTVTAFSSNPSLIPNPVVTYASPNVGGTLRFTPLTNANGTAIITVTVNDGQSANNMVTRTFAVSVAAVNDAPTISVIAAQQTRFNTVSSVIPFTIRDADTALSSLVLSAASSDETLLPLGNIILGGAGSNRTVQLTPAAGTSGPADVTLFVTDGALTASTTFVLIVSPPSNSPPVLSAISPQTTAEDTIKRVSFSALAGTNSSGLTLTAVSSDSSLVPAANLVVNGSAPDFTLSIMPQTNQWGTVIITLVASNGPLSVSRSFGLTVTSINDAPTLNPLGNLALLEDAGPRTVSLSGIGAGAANENQSLTINAISSNPALIPNPIVTYATPNSTGTLRFTALTNTHGSATITVSVNDGQPANNTILRSFEVVVAPVNDPVSISAIPSQETDEDVPLTTAFVLSDPDSINLDLWATSTNALLVPNNNLAFGGSGNNRTLTVAPAPDQFGTSYITVYVSDGVTTNTSGFLLTVHPVNDDPTLDVIPNFSTVSGLNGVFVLPLTGLSSGAPNETQLLVVTAKSSNPTLVPDPFVGYTGTGTNGTLVLRPGNSQQGNATITVTVTDAGATNNRFVRTFQVNISAPANAEPTMSLIPNQTTAEDTVLGPIAFSVRDLTTAAENLVVRADSSNPTLLPVSNIQVGGSGTNRTLTLIPARNQSGVATVYLTVIDIAFGASNQAFTVTVNPVNDRPSLTGIAAQTSPVDTLVGPLAFTVTDAETPSENLVVTATSGNQALVPNANIVLSGIGANRSVRLTPAAGQSGQSSITLSVSDGSLAATTTFLLTVSLPSNGLPIISPIADQVIDSMTPLEAVPFTVADPETPPQNLAITVTSSNPALLPATNIVLGGSGSVRTVTVLPLPDQTGTAIVSVAVSDGLATVTTSFRLSIQPPIPAVIVATQGDGAVLPDLNGRPLVRGRSYSLTARPGPGQIFTGWSGAITSSTPLLRFTMRSNLLLVANFVPNPYTPVRGIYAGLFYEADEVRHERSGYFKVVTTAGGTYTGMLGLGGRLYPLSGQLDTDRRATNLIRRLGFAPLQVEFQLGTESTLEQATGRVTDGSWEAGLLAERSIVHTATNRSSFAGKYTAIMPGHPDFPEAPGGDGFGIVTINPAGSAILTGVSGDNLPMTRSTPLSEQGVWPLYIPLYAGKGSILGWVTVTNRETDDLTGQLSWIRPSIRTSKYYPGGFTNGTALVGSSYQPPLTRTNRVMELTNCLVTFTGGNLTETITNQAILSPNNVLLNTSSNKMTTTLSVPSGLFSGSVVDPATGRTLKFRGALLQKRKVGSGFFSGTNETGQVWLGE